MPLTTSKKNSMARRKPPYLVLEIQTRENEPTIDEMRYDIAELEAMNLTTDNVIDILIHGVNNLSDVPDIEIKDEWNQLFGE